MARTINYALVVGMQEADAVALAQDVTGASALPDRLSIIAAAMLRDMSKGGILVPPEWAARIRAALGTAAPAEITEAVETAVGRCGEAPRVEWIPDPTQVQFYQTLADNAGITLNHQLKSLLDYGYMQGWFGMAAPDAHKILLTPHQFRYLQQLFAKDIPTGEDVIAALQKTNPEIVMEDGEFDPVMSSLGGE